MSAAALSAFTLQFNRYAPIPVLILGLIGNICNVATFTRPSLIKNPCSIYFLAACISNFNVLTFGLIIRSLGDGFRIDPVSTNLVFCEFRYFILHTSLSLSLWYTILAGIDRYCISSPQASRRKFSSRKIAIALVLITTLILMICYIHIFAYFSIEQTRSGPSCYAQAGTYRIFYDFLYFATYSFTPPLIMIVVGIATVRNIRRLRTQITPLGNNPMKKRDRQFVRMLLIQFLFTTLLTLPIAIQKLYATFTQDVSKDPLRIAVENFIPQLLRLFAFTQCSISFYLFFVSGRGFRLEFYQMIGSMLGRVLGDENRFRLALMDSTNIRMETQAQRTIHG